LPFSRFHPGAVYLHQGETYLITKLDLATHTAYCNPAQTNYYTQTKELTDLRIINTLRTKETKHVKVYLGEVEVTTSVLGYKRKAQFTDENLGEEALDLPPYTFQTMALWFDLPERTIARINSEQLDFAGALHAAEHAAIGILPLFRVMRPERHRRGIYRFPQRYRQAADFHPRRAPRRGGDCGERF